MLLHRLIVAAVLALLAAAAGGCPQDSSGNGSAATDIAAEPSAADASVGGEVMLTARGLDDAALTGASYKWYQTYGRVVDLMQSSAPTASFVAPSLPSDQSLRFRVDVRFSDGQTRSADVEVRVTADPLYSLGGGDGDSGGAEDPFPQVQIQTSKGSILVELNRDAAPLTVSNFLRYVDDGFYTGTIFHRVIADFVIQGGGYTANLTLKDTRPPILNESNNGLRNLRGTIAMARTTDVDSATSQFYINLVDNTNLDASSGDDGYTVFGKVIDGLDVVDEIAAVETANQAGLSDVPVDDIVIQSITRVSASSGGSAPKPRRPVVEDL